MTRLNDMKISVKLIAGFLIVSILTIVIGAVGIVCLVNSGNKYSKLYNDYGKSQGVLGQLAIDYQETRSIMKECLIAQNDISYRQQQAAKLSNYDKDIDAKLAAFEKTINTDTGRRSYNELVSELKDYKTTRDKVIALALEDKLDDANNVGRTELAPIVQKLDPNVQGTFSRKISNGDSLSRQYSDSDMRTIGVLIAFVAAVFLISLFLGILLSLNITRPLNSLVRYADQIADGDRSADVKVNRRDEIGKVAGAIRKIAASLGNIVSESLKVSAAAAKGDLSVRADESGFKGGYADIVKGLNETVDGFEKPIAVVVEQLRKIAQGQKHDEILNNYEGTYAVLIDALNSVRASLYALMSGAGELVEHSGRGDLKFRSDISGLKGGFLTIINGFHTTLDNILVPLDKTRDVLKQMSAGNNELRIEGDFKGDLEELTDSVNRMADNIDKAVNMASKALTNISHGRLDIDKVEDLPGSWAPISDSINTMLDFLGDTMKNINSAAEQVSAGSRQVSDSS